MFLRTLGALELEGSAFHWPKPLLLLGYLALEGPQDRRRLARLFWPGATDSMNSLTVALSQLRKHAPGAMEADRKTVRSLLRCDVQDLTAALDAGDAGRALGLYRGPFLADVHVSDLGVELEEWLYQQREHAAGRLRRGLLQQAEAEAASGRFGAAAGYAEHAARLAEAVPLAPEALERLFALLLAGDSPRAGEVGEEAAAFGAGLPRTPGEARARLREELAGPTLARGFPRYGSPLIGRTVELGMLEGLLLRPDVRLVTVVGPGGIGKTRLSAALADRLACRPADPGDDAGFVHGVFFVPLAPVAGGEGVLPAIADALGLAADEAQRARPPGQGLLDFLRDKRLLLVLDNFEQLLDQGDEDVLEGILRAAAGVKVVVTSRERLRLRDEQVLHLQGLELPSAGALRADARYAAAELFCRRARLVVPDFAPGEGDGAHLHDICRLLGGMPLGLELAASWVDVLPLAGIAASIRRSLDFLEARVRDVPERHRSMRAVFDTSFGRLGPDEQAVFARLSVFRGGFRLEAAQDVAEASVPVLASLAGKSLLRFDRSQERYFLHELLRQYAGERLAQDASAEEAAHERHCAYCCGWLEREADKLSGPEQQEAIAAIEAEADNCLSAWRWAAQRGRWPRLAQAATALGAFLHRRGRFASGGEAFGMAAAGSRAEPALRARLLAWQGIFEYALGDAEGAIRHLDESISAVAAAEAAGREARDERAFTLLHLGRIQLGRDAEAAESWARESLGLYRALDRPAGVAEALGILGEAAFRRGDGQRAQHLFEESLTLYRGLDDQRGVASLLPMLSFMAMHTTRFEEAARLAEESYALCRRMGDLSSLAGGLGLLGMSQFWLGRFAEARSLFEEGLSIHEKLGNLPALAQAHAYVGLASLRLGRYDEARLHGERGLAHARDLGNRAMTGWCLWLLGCAALGRGRYREAGDLLENSVATYRDIGQASELGWSLAVQAHVKRALHQPGQAGRILAEVLSGSAETRDFPSVILALPTVALLLCDAGEEVRAVELLALMTRYPVVANCHWFEDIAVRQLRGLAAGLPEQVASEALARGRALDLWETTRLLSRDRGGP